MLPPNTQNTEGMPAIRSMYRSLLLSTDPHLPEEEVGLRRRSRFLVMDTLLMEQYPTRCILRLHKYLLVEKIAFHFLQISWCWLPAWIRTRSVLHLLPHWCWPSVNNPHFQPTPPQQGRVCSPLSSYPDNHWLYPFWQPQEMEGREGYWHRTLVCVPDHLRGLM